MDFLLLQEVQFLEVKDDDLSQWEIVDVLDSEEGAEEEDNEDDNGVQKKGIGSWASLISRSVPPETDQIDGILRLIHPAVACLKHHPNDVDDDSIGGRRLNDVEDEIGEGQFDDEDEDVDDYNGFDLDDELVPWSVNGKFVRQRMRKLGKRAFSKMHNSKRSPYLFVRPGCVRGKHGLGHKHNC